MSADAWFHAADDVCHCRVPEDPQPVEVGDRVDGRPEVVGRMCQRCYRLVPDPPLRAPEPRLPDPGRPPERHANPIVAALMWVGAVSTIIAWLSLAFVIIAIVVATLVVAIAG